MMNCFLNQIYSHRRVPTNHFFTISLSLTQFCLYIINFNLLAIALHFSDDFIRVLKSN